MSHPDPTAPPSDIPMRFRVRGGKTVMVMPDGCRAIANQEATIDNTLVKAIARGFRWQGLLHNGTYATIEEIAAAERINPSYISRFMRLANLAPDIVETLLECRYPARLTLKDLMKPFPMNWGQQELLFLGLKRPTRSA